jgi:CHRD domain
MKRLLMVFFAVFFLCGAAAASGDDATTFRTSLRGANEVPAINSDGTGSFAMTIHEDGTITFTETFANLTSNIILSHIHFGEIHVAGGVMVFLCGGDSQPACPAATSGTITGTITAANVTGPTGQGVTAGDLASALRAIRQGAGYVNIHTVKFPGGEIRGQLRIVDGDQE